MNRKRACLNANPLYMIVRRVEKLAQTDAAYQGDSPERVADIIEVRLIILDGALPYGACIPNNGE